VDRFKGRKVVWWCSLKIGGAAGDELLWVPAAHRSGHEVAVERFELDAKKLRVGQTFAASGDQCLLRLYRWNGMGGGVRYEAAHGEGAQA
jgi:hypothetical protein